MTTRTQDITEGKRQAHLTRPDGAAEAGVLLLPSVHGIDNYVKDYARLLAEAGLPTLIWEPFPGHKPAHSREDRTARLASLTDAAAMREMTFWLDYMLGALALKAVGTIGFCLGGRYGLLLCAHDRRIACCVPYYPTIETPLLPGQDEDVVAQAASIRCPVHMITAGNDHLTSRDVFTRLQQNLQSRPDPTVIEFYPEGEHGFMQVDRRPGKANEVAVRLSVAQAVPFLNATLNANANAATKAERREREQCWLLSVELADPPPKLATSMEGITRQHHDYIHDLDAKGILVGAGAFRDETGNRQGTGLIVIRAATRAEADAIARQEPYIANGVRILKLVPWQRSAGY